MNAKQILSTVDKLQLVKQQISALELQEKVLVDSLKAEGLGLYAGSVADCSVTEVEVSRIDVTKLIKKLNIAQHVFDKFYKINTTQVRAKIVNKTIEIE